MFKLLIMGATGLVGQEVLRQALLDTRITHVVAISRRALKAHPKLENHVLDFKNLPLNAPWWHVDAGICALGTTTREAKSRKEYRLIDLEYPLTMARAIKQKGAHAFAHTSSIGASANSCFYYLKIKGEVERELRCVGFSSLTIVRPSFISGTREKRRTMESLFMSILKPLKTALPRRWQPISSHRIADALLRAVLSPRAGINIWESETL